MNLTNAMYVYIYTRMQDIHTYI